ncbi:MAG: DUF1566 domain-containing protein [Ferruginibacter sp.]
MKIRFIKSGLIAVTFIMMLNACKKSAPGATLASVTTVSVTDITTITATAGGVVNGDGGSTVTSRGVCYATHAYPTVADSVITSGAGTGQFSVNLIKLDAGTLYYVRSFAVNGVETAYGEQVTFATVNITLGESYRGGKVAYILIPGDPGFSGDKQKGIIVTPSDEPATNWGINVVTGATATSLGVGNANTSAIISILSTGSYAARVCYDLTLAAFSDWYLPSVEEMNILYLNKDIVGGFNGTQYWTSSELNINTAWSYDFSLGSSVADNKATIKSVRPVRSF